ncbi:MAG: DUF3806 domain-containing protein [Cellvibrionaceae bacterium]|nr:DUF3806 domain-containing protein [Cellvibrionaceae bacterium]
MAISRHLALLLLALAPLVQAQEEVELSDLSWLDRSHLERQVNSIDEISSGALGSPIRGSRQDLKTLQRIIDRGLVKKDQVQLQQAMGAVLGNILVLEPALEWKIYEDKLGRSRAVCVKGSNDCIFPITILSRRMEVGLLPRVEAVYQRALEMIADKLPQNPYDFKPKHSASE